MQTSQNTFIPDRLPVKNSLNLVYTLTLFITLLMSVASAAGIIYQGQIYPLVELRRMFVSNDVVNLVVGLPSLLVALWLVRRGRLIGLLFLPGALFFVLYNYLIYLIAMPFNFMLPLNLALVILSVYTMTSLVAGIDGETVKKQLAGQVPERLAGGILAGLGILFLLRNASVIAGALTSQTLIPDGELSTLVVDFITIPAWVIGGVLLWRRKPLGYVSGMGLLYQGSALFLGLIIFLLIQPLLTDAPFALTDIVVVAIMGMICFIPFGLFVRGVLSDESPSPEQ